MSKRKAYDEEEYTDGEHIISKLEYDIVAIDQCIYETERNKRGLEENVNAAKRALLDAEEELEKEDTRVRDETREKMEERDVKLVLAKIVETRKENKFYAIVSEFDATDGASLIAWLKGTCQNPQYSTLAVGSDIHEMFKRNCVFRRGHIELHIVINRTSHNEDDKTSYRVCGWTAYLHDEETGKTKSISKECVLYDAIYSDNFMDCMLHCPATSDKVQSDGRYTDVDVNCIFVSFKDY